ncbi:MAG: hypothetical protein U5J64_00180 [Halobacteriales archaeon]|nr:hypothetical protein [Halobacteriales archaeon]
MLGRFDFTSARYPLLYLPAFSYGYLYIEQRTVIVGIFEISAIWLSATVLIGAIILNSILRAVHGRSGPEKRPKKRFIAGYYYAGLLTSPDPPRYDRKKDWLENIFELIGWDLLSLRFVFVVFILPAYFILTYASVYYLFLHVQAGSAGRIYLGGGLLILQTIFLLKSKLDICPPAPPSDAVEYIETPEYIRWREDVAEHESDILQSDLDDFDS